MLQEFFGLQRDPFSLSPDLDFLFLSTAHEEAIAHFAYGLEQNEDVIALIGDIGTGKTLAIHRLLDQVSGSVVPVFLNVTTIGFGELLRLTLLKLGQNPGEGKSPAALIHDFEMELIRQREQGKSILLIVDEAQNLSVESLESVRLLLNLAQPAKQALQIILAGQLSLQEKLDMPRMRQLRQRIRVSYTFGTLNRQEVKEYIQHRLRKAGREKPLFKEKALDRISECSRGVPRVVNYLANGALLAAYVDKTSSVSVKHVDDAVAESGTLLGDEVPGHRVDAALEEQFDSPPGPEPDQTVAPEKPREPIARSAAAPVAPAVRRAKAPKRSRSAGRWVALAIVVVLVGGILTYPKWAPMLGWPATFPLTGNAEQADRSAPGDLSAPQTSVEPVEVATQQMPNDPAVAQSKTQVAVIDTVPEAAVQEPATSPDTPVAAVGEPKQEAPESGQETPAAAESIVVHVASFRDPDRATKLADKLIAHGVKAYRADTEVNGKIFHRVYLGPFMDEEQAQRIVSDLKNDGLITYARVIHR